MGALPAVIILLASPVLSIAVPPVLVKAGALGEEWQWTLAVSPLIGFLPWRHQHFEIDSEKPPK